MTEPVQPFRLDLVNVCLGVFLSKIGCGSCGKCPSLFSEFDNCEADNLENMHKMILRQMTVRVLRL
jgi:hypothetical protein